MTNGFFTPKIDLMGHIQGGMNSIGPNSVPTLKLEDTPSSSFKDVMSGLAQGLNNDLSAPDKLLKASMSGDGSVDIHDVMTAMAKAEISVNIATQVTSKVIQSYDKIMQISV